MQLFYRFYTLFDHTQCNVSNGKRLFAYLVDWFAGSLLTTLPLALIWLKQTKDMEAMARVNLMSLSSQVGVQTAYIAGCIAVIFALFFYVFVPLRVWKGQTLGKRMMEFKIVKTNGDDVTLKTLCIRQIIGIILIEGSIYSISTILHQALSLAFHINFIDSLMYVGLVISAFSVLLVIKFPSCRMLHDYLAHTKVIPFESEAKSESI